MKIKNALIAIAAFAVSTSVAMAQPPQDGPPGGGHPILSAIDSDHNHELSAEEIRNATKVLRGLDKNGDGKLDEEDLGQMGPPGGGPPGGGPGGRGGPGGGSSADQGEMVSDFASRLLAFDKNDNGKIEKEELPPRMQAVIDRLDKNKDDVLDESELGELKAAAKEAASSEGGNRGGANGRRGREGAEGERGGRGGRGGEGARGGAGGGRGGEGGRGGAGGGRGGEGGRGGAGGGRGGEGGRGGVGGGRGGEGGGMDRMVDHAFEFDKDGDGKLSREELMEFAKNMPQQGGGPPGGGRGGPGGGGPPRGGRGR